MKSVEKYIYLILIVILVAVISSGATYMVMKDKNNNSEIVDKEQDYNNENNEDSTFKEYKALEEITLKDGSKWLVIKDSDSKDDYVTAISVKDYTPSYDDENEDKSNALMNAYLESKSYNESYFKELLEKDILPTLDFKLKEVDGYSIRLIKVNEILQLYPKFKYDESSYEWTYTGETKDIVLPSTLTMTPAEEKITVRHFSFYILNRNMGYDSDSVEQVMIRTSSGGGIGSPINPVINVYKSEIKN